MQLRGWRSEPDATGSDARRVSPKARWKALRHYENSKGSPTRTTTYRGALSEGGIGVDIKLRRMPALGFKLPSARRPPEIGFMS